MKYQISKIKIVELPLRGNDFLNFELCVLIFNFPRLRCHRPVVDTNVINQAGPETASLTPFTSADIQAAIGAYWLALRLGIFGSFNLINVQGSERTIPDQTNVMPLAIGNDRIRY
jgi:hypothetical protein